MSADSFKQDMPPKGGFASIQYERVPLKTPWSGYKIFAVFAGVTAFSYYMYMQDRRTVRRYKRANDDVYVALEPLLLAERDRIYLNQLRKNREEEAELMKNVPGWKVGTWYGEPLYKTIGDKILDPISWEYYAHTSDFEYNYMHTYDWWL